MISICTLSIQLYCYSIDISVPDDFLARMISSPAEGIVVFTVHPGDIVKVGDKLGTITNLKTENNISNTTPIITTPIIATAAGKIREFYIPPDCIVSKHASLLYIDKFEETQQSDASDEPNIELE